MKRTFLYLLSSLWDFIKEPGGLFVLIGVTFESIFEWTNWPRDEDRRKKLKRTFGLVLILGLIMELPETAKLRKLAGDANERASTNEVQVALLQSNNLVLQSNVVMVAGQVLGLNDQQRQISNNLATVQEMVESPALKAKLNEVKTSLAQASKTVNEVREVLTNSNFETLAGVAKAAAPRTISSELQMQLFKSTQSLPKTKIVFFFRSQDVESEGLVNQIASPLNSVGFEVAGAPTIIASSEIYRGVGVCDCGGTNGALVAAIVDVLKNSGCSVSTNLSEIMGARFRGVYQAGVFVSVAGK